MEESMINKLKGAYKSLTIWLNAAFVMLLSNADLTMQVLRDNLTGVSQWLNADLLKYAALFIIGVNVLLRFKTNKSLADK
jgi:hypothetical protein